MKTCGARSAKEWRAWLQSHHKSDKEVWLIFHKQHTGQPSVEYDAAVSEALCFGWVDSLIKRIDDDRYARKFTPRKADSVWSDSNRRRYEELRAQGRLEAAGTARPPTGRRPERRPAPPSRVPAYFLAGLKKHPAAARAFDALAPSHRRRYVMWVDTAKQEDTKARRLKEAVRMLSSARKLGLK